MFFFFNDTATTEIYTLSLHDALPIYFSDAITVDERLQLAAPTSMSSISLNGAVHLDWADNAYLTNPARFKWYRVYSAGYNLDTGQCGTDWALEGTTVGHEFLAAQLTNGVPRCFASSAISVEGYESLWSPLPWFDKIGRAHV